MKWITAIRLWIVKLILTDSEKYLINLAMIDRINLLERTAVTERWVNKEDIAVDLTDYMKLKPIFYTDLQ